MLEIVLKNSRKSGLQVSAFCGMPSPAAVRGRGTTNCDPIACIVHMFIEFSLPLHPSHYEDNLILVNQKLHVSLN